MEKEVFFKLDYLGIYFLDVNMFYEPERLYDQHYTFKRKHRFTIETTFTVNFFGWPIIPVASVQIIIENYDTVNPLLPQLIDRGANNAFLVKSATEVNISGHLKDTLGLPQNELTEGSYPIIIKNMPDPNIITGFHIYSDIVDPQRIGHATAPFLRTLWYKGSGTTDMVFNPRYYLPVRRSNYQTLEISVRSNLGFEVKFKEGTANIVLHIRPNG